tara:strand:+ start:22 stop:966 length:945 start_codon:yes stop_codon:yes gene_type:complete
MKKLTFLESLLGSCANLGDEYLFICPFCKHNKKKLSINITKGKWKCWICDKAGRSIKSLVRQIGGPAHLRTWGQLTNSVDLSEFGDIRLETLFESKTEKVKEIIDLPKEFRSLATRKKVRHSRNAMAYLKNRNISFADILTWKIGVCTTGDYANRIIIPSFDIEGKLNYFVGRSIDGSWPKYTNAGQSKKEIIFNELNIDFSKDVIIVEGAFDAIVSGENSVPLLGSTLKDGDLLFNRLVEAGSVVYMALDDDAKKKQSKIIELLLHYGLTVYEVSTSGFEDVGTMTKQQFSERKAEATLADSWSLFRTAIANG